MSEHTLTSLNEDSEAVPLTHPMLWTVLASGNSCRSNLKRLVPARASPFGAVKDPVAPVR
jgi:hypothetical protein